MDMIKVENLSKSYNGDYCLRNVNLHVKRGEFVSIVGENGSGKTTLLEILAGVRAPDEGSVLIDGKNIFAMSDKQLSKLRRTKLGVVYQNFELIPTLTAEENIRLAMLLEKVPKREINERVEKLTNRLRLENVIKKYPNELSGGQRQRAALARAVSYSPEVLLLDEPTSGLDMENAKNVTNFLCELNSDYNVTVLQITHSEGASSFGKVVPIRELNT